MDDIDGMASAIGELEGKTVLVGSHSGDTVELIEKLGAGRLEPIEEHQYDNFFVITVYGPGERTRGPLEVRSADSREFPPA